MRTIHIVCLADGVSASTDILGRAGEQNAVQLSIDASAVAAALADTPEIEAEEPAGLMAALYSACARARRSPWTPCSSRKAAR